MRFYVRIYKECEISQEPRKTAEVVLHAEHHLFGAVVMAPRNLKR